MALAGGAMFGSRDNIGHAASSSSLEGSATPEEDDKDNENSADAGDAGAREAPPPVRVSMVTFSEDLTGTDYTLGGFGLYSVDAQKHTWCLARYINDNSVHVGDDDRDVPVAVNSKESHSTTGVVPLILSPGAGTGLDAGGGDSNLTSNLTSKDRGQLPESKESRESLDSDDTFDVNAPVGGTMRAGLRKSMFNTRRTSKEEEEKRRLMMMSRQPNVTFVKSRKARTALVVATRDIAVGEELFVAYGRGYWAKRGMSVDDDVN